MNFLIYTFFSRYCVFVNRGVLQRLAKRTCETFQKVVIATRFETAKLDQFRNALLPNSLETGLFWEFQNGSLKAVSELPENTRWKTPKVFVLMFFSCLETDIYQSFKNRNETPIEKHELQAKLCENMQFFCVSKRVSKVCSRTCQKCSMENGFGIC